MESRKIKQKLRKRRSKLVKGTSQRLRVVVYKSNRYFSVQAIDDTKGHTLVADSTKNFSPSSDFSRKNKAWVQKIGENFAEELKKKGVKRIVFDRNGYPYQGKIELFCEILRQSGVQFS